MMNHGCFDHRLNPNTPIRAPCPEKMVTWSEISLLLSMIYTDVWNFTNTGKRSSEHSGSEAYKQQKRVSPRNLKENISCCGHLALTYGGWDIVPPDFLLPKMPNLPSHFFQRVLLFSCGLKSRTQLGCCTEWLHHIQMYNNSPSMHDP